MRKIIVKRPDAIKPIVIESEAVTFSQLRSQLSEIPWSSMQTTVRETLVTLDLDDALLPEGDFAVILNKKEQKGGATKKEAPKGPYADNNFNELRRLCKSRETIKAGMSGSYGTADEMRAALEADDKKQAKKAGKSVAKTQEEKPVEKAVEKAMPEVPAKGKIAYAGNIDIAAIVRESIAKMKSAIADMEKTLVFAEETPNYDSKEFVDKLNRDAERIYNELRSKNLLFKIR